MSQTKKGLRAMGQTGRAVLPVKQGGMRIRIKSPKESSVQKLDTDEATRLRHEIAILESKKRILKTLDALGA